MRSITEEWDKISKERIYDIESGNDIVYHKTIIPYITKILEQEIPKDTKIVDIGCGIAFLTNIIKSMNYDVTGIDIDRNSIKYAQNKYSDIKFLNVDFNLFMPDETFDFCLINMVIHNIKDINMFMKKLYNITGPNGQALFLLPHPCYWPLKYIDINSFDYDKENQYLLPFKTRNNNKYKAEFSYFHRPISLYYNKIIEHGFSVKKIEEIIEINGKNMPHLLSFFVQKI
jgi:ubiquinone/menaquinone biosynthesis C-methylase UbiE